MYTDRWICGTISTASTIYAHVPASILPKIKAIAYTRKRQAKQPCLDTEGATESDGCNSEPAEGLKFNPGKRELPSRGREREGDVPPPG